MNQYNEISTLQYMGSKARIISHICDPIMKNKSIQTVVDLFAGTGSVGYALKSYKNVISNDIEYYAYIINQAILNGCNFSELEETSFWAVVEQKYTLLQEKVSTALFAEKIFFVDNVDYKLYQTFCEKTPSVFEPYSDDPRMKELAELVSHVIPGNEPALDFPCLFLTYFANAYFGIAQCCQIDALRGVIEQVMDEHTKNVLLTVLMSVMSATASTTTHFAQFLKVKSKSTCNNLLTKRKINIIEECKALMKEYRKSGLCSQKECKTFDCYNLDFSECLDSIVLNKSTLVYADPPYFKEHYSRYYHVLNTLCLYDYPAMAINPQTHELSIGRYREDRRVSDFGKKAKALGAFETLITKCATAGAWLMISYSDNSIVDITDLQTLAEKQYDVLIEKVELSHSKQGRSSISKVDEYIFICRPKEFVHDVNEKLSVIKELKKASSQMPYWLPQKDVTSRNAVMIIEQKAIAFKEGLIYLSEKCKSFVDEKNIVLKNMPAQNISMELLPNESVDLILTDPPYTDQVPYLEYNQLWYKVMGWQGFTHESLEAELVVSDAPSRNKDGDDFNRVFEAILGRISPALKTNGYFIMFYHSFDLKSWSDILRTMQKHGCFSLCLFQ